MTFFRKKPVVISAVQWTGDNELEVQDFMGAGPLMMRPDHPAQVLIPTLEGTMAADIGDWIIRGVKLEIYPCKPDIFRATYEQLDSNGYVVPWT